MKEACKKVLHIEDIGELKQKMLVRYKTETGHGTANLAIPLTHPTRPDY